jgi:hypothetical protein
MKKPIILLAFTLGLFLTSSAQSFEGTWKGTMMQDSPVVRIDFEMVLEQKEGKIAGYLYRLFIVNDSLIYNTVRVTARVSDNMLIVEDDESVSRNFEEKANRKIKAAYFFKLNPKQPNADTLTGEWTTSRYKKYMAMSGKVNIRREVFYETTQLFKRLEEKQLHTSIAFVPKKTAPDVAINKPNIKTNPETTETKPVEPKPSTNTAAVVNKNKSDSLNNSVVVTQPIIKEPEGKTTQEPVSKPVVTNNTTVNNPVKKDSVQNSAAVTKPAATETKPPATNVEGNVAASTKPTTAPNSSSLKNNTEIKKDSVATNTTVKTNSNQPTNKPVQTKPQPTTAAVVNTQQKPVTQNKPNTGVVTNNTSQPAATNKPTQQPPVANNPVVEPATEKPGTMLIKTDEATVKDPLPGKQKPVTTVAPPVINNPVITKRETEVIQTLTIVEDSVTLSLYDNGEIDGDTVSVFVNNEKVISNVGLKASAYKHTVYFKPGETIQLTLFAENLGTIPPNSGLLVVYSGEQRYQVFFTSTLNKSAVVLLKRE